MSLVDTLQAGIASRGSALIEEKGDTWLGKLIDQGRRQTAPGSPLSAVIPDEAARTDLNEALNVLDANRQPFVRLTNIGFTMLVGHWADGKAAEARRLYLATQATYEERRAAMHGAGDAAAADREERDIAWAKVEAVLKTVGTIGLKILIKVAAGSIGIPLPV